MRWIAVAERDALRFDPSRPLGRPACEPPQRLANRLGQNCVSQVLQTSREPHAVQAIRRTHFVNSVPQRSEAHKQPGEMRREEPGIAGQQFVGALPVKQNLYARARGKFKDFPLSIDTARAERLVLVPGDRVERLLNPGKLGVGVMGLNAGVRDHLVDVFALVIALDSRARGKRVLLRPCAGRLQVPIRDAYDR